jgi:hypothetical protein
MKFRTLSSDNLFRGITIALFSCISLIGILNHVIWSDEAQHFLLARDSQSLVELWFNTRYEGHPILWNILLYVITRFSANPIWMQLMHLAISVLAVSLFLFSSPLPRPWNAFFIFSYFVLFEYTLISRNYSLILLFFFLTLRLYKRIKNNYVAISICLSLLANTHLFGLILCGWIALLLIIDALKKPMTHSQVRSLKIGAVILLLGAFLSIYQILPPSDSPFLPKTTALFSIQSAERTLAFFLKGFLPVPDLFNYHFWNTNLFSGYSKSLGGVLSLAVLLTTFICLDGKRNSMILFYGFTLSLIILVILLPAHIVKVVRYYGIVFIVFMGGLWISYYDNRQMVWQVNISSQLKNRLITSLLIIQMMAGITALFLDFHRPFSESKNVVSFLRENGLANQRVITLVIPIPTISCYLERKVYSMPSGELCSFFKWNEKELYMRGTNQETLLAAKKFVRQYEEDGILITYQPIHHLHGIKLLKSFQNAVVNTENFYVYKVLSKDSS